jgi:hypothetical protein
VLELTPRQLAILQQLAAQGFAVTSFPMYANAIGVRRGDFAALLAPAPDAALALQGEPCYLLNGNLAVPVVRGGKKLYTWKKQSVEATPEREQALRTFREDLLRILESEIARGPARDAL